MEALGDALKRTREHKGYTLDQISRDTNIARRFLEALETEDFSVFPGEPYLLGFLRNYSEYLGLNPQDMISAYRTIKIQEQPIPVEQLLHTKSSFPVLPVLGFLLLLAALGFALYRFIGPEKSQLESSAQEPVRQAVEYSLAAGQLERRLYIKDRIVVSLGSEKYILTISALGSNVTIGTPRGDFVLELGQEVALDLDGDGIKDATLFIADLFKNAPDKGVLVRLDILPTEALAGLSPTEADQEIEVVATTVGLASPAIFTSPSAYPFTLQATFRGYCMFRWESDRNPREERYFQKAEVQNIQSQNGVRLWISNASTVKLVVIGGGKTVNLELGGPGEVVVVDLKWIKDQEGRFVLTTVRLD